MILAKLSKKANIWSKSNYSVEVRKWKQYPVTYWLTLSLISSLYMSDANLGCFIQIQSQNLTWCYQNTFNSHLSTTHEHNHHLSSARIVPSHWPSSWSMRFHDWFLSTTVPNRQDGFVSDCDSLLLISEETSRLVQIPVAAKKISATPTSQRKVAPNILPSYY